MGSICDSGLCMCAFGYHPVKVSEEGDPDKYECQPSYETLSVAAAANATGIEIKTMLEAQDHSNRMVQKNIFIATLWASGCVASLASLGIFFVLRHRSAKAKAEAVALNQLLS